MDFLYVNKLAYKIVRHVHYITGRELGFACGQPCAECIEGNVKTFYYM